VALQFGIFDHVDDNGTPLADLFETRLKLVEQYDRSGFRSYHIAEHHSTPLGMAPSPSVFLAAVAQRSQRLRFGPLLYVTPMYHPLRVAEEVVMLDHMSRGRLELGLGRGASPIEIAGFDVEPADAPAMNREATDLILKALTSEVVSYEGKFYRCKNVRIEARPLQQPYPPLWFAPTEPGRAADAARLKGNMVTLSPNAGVKALTENYRAAWQAQGDEAADLPLLGVFRHVVVADTDGKARDLARPAYRRWRRHMAFLWEWGGLPLPDRRRLSGRIRRAGNDERGYRRRAGNRPPLRPRQHRADRHHLFRQRFRFRLIALRCGGAFGRVVRERGHAGISLNKQRRAGHRGREFANRLQALELQRLRRAEALLLVRARVERGECPRAQALHSRAVMGSVAIAFIQRTRIGARVREQVPAARLVVMHANHLMAEGTFRVQRIERPSSD
jgi:alkanesulfonate monooxygenase SsuD/methylene tetrahydromethanopterin reductase-like flavin-dependent oxidoreductase (luciferase family)